MSKVTVKPGAIPQRIPRPLTREEAGGDASAEDLARLAESFSKPERKSAPAQDAAPSNNGWAS